MWAIYLALIAMDKDRVITAIKDNSESSGKLLVRNCV